MPLLDSKTGKIRKEYDIKDLEKAAQEMRIYNMVSLCAAKSGHSGGTLSIMDIAAALYLHIARHDPENYTWENRDRIIWSVGHKAPSLYIALGMSGYFPVEGVATLRKFGSPFQGHPHWQKLPGVEISTGSLGQGLSSAVGMALAARLDKKDYKVFAIMGDGEQQEGQIWEAVMSAGHFKLDNVIGIIDRNRLQIDGWVKDVMNVEPLEDKYKAFGWEVFVANGHDMKEIVDTFNKALKVVGKPSVIIFETIKGKGVDFMEDIAGWHGKSPSCEEMNKAIAQIGLDNPEVVDTMFDIAKKFQEDADKKIAESMPKFKENYWWNSKEIMKVQMDPTRMGFGRLLKEKGNDERVVCLGADISGSITISEFYKSNPERKNRFLSIGIAEANMTCIAAGLAKEGKLPVIGTYGVFASMRNADQLRTTVAYGDLNVMIGGAHGGVSVGPDGATHQALEEISIIASIPNMLLSVPCDSIETYRATDHLLFNETHPKYLRFAREATPVVTTMKSPFVFGKANVIRFRGEKQDFKEAFEHILASEYKNENEDISIIACGPMVPEAMRASWILKKEFNIEARVLNVHTIKPLDIESIAKSASETGVVITAEEHQVGGFGNIIAGAILQSSISNTKPVKMGQIGVKDRFGESGAPWELIKMFECSAEHIVKMAKELLNK
ncbi:MAG: transketolase [Candidatus Coatesbacteria bacterium]|nr:transketolase [Candidatus Coatesbacteria bacterium]